MAITGLPAGYKTPGTWRIAVPKTRWVYMALAKYSRWLGIRCNLNEWRANDGLYTERWIELSWVGWKRARDIS